MSNDYDLNKIQKKSLGNSRRPIGLNPESLLKMQALRVKMEALKPPPPEENFLTAATPILLYQVSWGRNAWHSTWVSRYVRNTLKCNWADAKKYVNDRRVQGTAYHLLVTPGWHVQFDRKAYLVCEINTTRPFSRLMDATFLADGIKEDQFLKDLNPSSEIWSGDNPKFDSIIVQETKNKASDFVLWTDRTSEPLRQKTPGRYGRVISGDRWSFAPIAINASNSFDTSSYATHVVED